MAKNEKQVINYEKPGKSYFEVEWTYQEDVGRDMAKNNISIVTTKKWRKYGKHKESNETKEYCSRKLG